MKWFLVKLVLATTIQVLSSAWSTFAVTHTTSQASLDAGSARTGIRSRTRGVANEVRKN